jgi:hypothetical protein
MFPNLFERAIMPSSANNTVRVPVEIYLEFKGIVSRDFAVLFLDSATLQSTQWVIKAAYNQRSLQSTPLYTA